MPAVFGRKLRLWLNFLNRSWGGEYVYLSNYRRKIDSLGFSSEEQKRTVLSVCNTLEDVFGDSVEISFSLSPQTERFNNEYGNTSVEEIVGFCFEGSLEVVIHFSELTISNSLGESRTLLDLFCKFTINISPSGESCNISSLQGARTTYTNYESSSLYRHSHLTSMYRENPVRFTNFCLGSDEFKTAKSMASGNYDEDFFRVFLLCIKPYLEHESLEGGPHRTINSIYGDVVSINPTIDNFSTHYSAIEATYPIKKSNVSKLTWSGNFPNKRLRSDDLEIQECIVTQENLLNISSIVGLSICTKINGSFTKIERLRDVSPSRLYFTVIGTYEYHYISFKNKKYLLKIVEEVFTDEISNQTRYLNPNFLNYVKHRWEQKANEAFIKDYSFARLADSD